MRSVRGFLACITFLFCTTAAFADSKTIFVPIVQQPGFAQSVFGVQSNHLSRPTVKQKAIQLGARWVRIQGLSWRAVQPKQYGALDWHAVAAIENDLIAAKDAGLTPTVVIWDSPAWATINKHKTTSCGAIRSDRFADFAEFMKAAIERYSKPPYNVRYWELGNEPDVKSAHTNCQQRMGMLG